MTHEPAASGTRCHEPVGLYYQAGGVSCLFHSGALELQARLYLRTGPLDSCSLASSNPSGQEVQIAPPTLWIFSQSSSSKADFDTSYAEQGRT